MDAAARPYVHPIPRTQQPRERHVPVLPLDPRVVLVEVAPAPEQREDVPENGQAAGAGGQGQIEEAFETRPGVSWGWVRDRGGGGALDRHDGAGWRPEASGWGEDEGVGAAAAEEEESEEGQELEEAQALTLHLDTRARAGAG